MIKKLSRATFIFVLMLLHGCVSQNTVSNPNAQTGAAIGALTGAVVGGNVGDGSGSNIAGGAVLGAVAGAAVGNASSDRKEQTGGWEQLPPDHYNN